MDDSSMAELDDAYEGAVREQEVMRKVQDLMIEKAYEVIEECYPKDIYELSAEGYRELEGVVIDIGVDACRQINSAIYRGLK